MKSMMIDFQIRITNQALKVILNNQYLKRYGNGMVYTIRVQMAVDDMQQNFMV